MPGCIRATVVPMPSWARSADSHAALWSTHLRRLVVCLLAAGAVLIPAASSAAKTVKIPASVVVLTSPPDADQRCHAVATMQISELPGALSYSVTYFDTEPRVNRMGTLTGPPFPADAAALGGEFTGIPAAAGGTHRWGLSSATGRNCADRKSDFLSPGRWTQISATATLDDKLRISGTVRKADGTGASGVRISIKGPTSTTATTNASGNYSAVVKKGTYVISTSANFCVSGASKCEKSKKGVKPSATVNFGPPPKAKISGTVTGTSCTATTCTLPKPLSGVLVRATGGSEAAEDTTDVDGTYEIDVPTGTLYKVTPTLFGRTFAPGSRSVQLNGPQKGVDFRGCGGGGLRIVRLEGGTGETNACGPNGIDWTMASRVTEAIVRSWGKNEDGVPSRKFVDPDWWTVGLKITRGGKPYVCSGDDDLWHWRITKGPKGYDLRRRIPEGCTTEMEVSKLGTYEMEAVKYTAAGRKVGIDPDVAPLKRTIKVRDLVIAAMGDSNGSGEGTSSLFFYTGCSRGLSSYQYQAAQEIENADPHTSVTLLWTSCSGASARHLYKSTFRGTLKNDEQNPQMETISNLMTLVPPKRPAKIDAAFVSIGVNDIGFGPVLEYCVARNDCPTLHTRAVLDSEGYVSEFKQGSISGDPTFREFMKTDLLGKLPRELAGFKKAYNRPLGARRLPGLGRLSPDRVFHTQYPDFTRGTAGTCDTRDTPIAGGKFGNNIARWPPETWGWFGETADSLNAAVRGAGFNAYTFPQDLFRMHGYCEGDSWFTGIFGRLLRLNKTGPFHPDPRAHAVSASALRTAFCVEFYSDLRCEGEIRE